MIVFSKKEETGEIWDTRCKKKNKRKKEKRGT
jgi:hypothetical protein